VLCVLLVSAVGLCCPVTAARGEDRVQTSEADSPLDLEEYAGKVVFVDFWASWCAPCKRSFPWMVDLQKRLSEQGLVIVTVNVDRTRKAADRFLEQLDSELPVIFDPEGEIAEAYQLETMPSSYIYGRDGTLRATHMGFHPDKVDEIEAELKALLLEEAPDAKAH
jgi:thiol-disulfide isomerase/thioredoxin